MAVVQERRPPALSGFFPPWICSSGFFLFPGSFFKGPPWIWVAWVVPLPLRVPRPGAASLGVSFFLLRGRCEMPGAWQAAAARFPMRRLVAVVSSPSFLPSPEVTSVWW